MGQQLAVIPATATDSAVAWQLVRLGGLLRRTLDRALQPLGTSTDQVHALTWLAGREGARIRDLAEALGMERNSASELVERLVQRQLVRRERDHADRRQVTLALMPAGRELVEGAVPALQAVVQPLLLAYSEPDQAQARRLIAQAISVLQAGDGPVGALDEERMTQRR